MEKLGIKSEVQSPSTTVATENLYARFNHSGGQKLEHVRIFSSSRPQDAVSFVGYSCNLLPLVNLLEDPS